MYQNSGRCSLPRIGLRFRMAVTALVCAFLLAVPGEAKTKPDRPSTRGWLAEKVRHELVTLPYYGVFDNLEFQIASADTVILSGQVTRPTLKKDAENVVRRIEGVNKVVNKIEVLPVSFHDDDLRRAAYRMIFSRTGLDRYALGAVPSIHIIVKNGHITLTGVVATEADKNLAGITARQVPLAFGVTNNLRVEKRG